MLKASTEFSCPDISAHDMERLNSMLVLNSVELGNKLEVDNTNKLDLMMFKRLSIGHDPSAPKPRPGLKISLLKFVKDDLCRNPIYMLYDYAKKDSDKELKLPSRGLTYAFVFLKNEATKELELRIAPNENGSAWHKGIAGYARRVICAGEVVFDQNGCVSTHNFKSNSYQGPVEYIEVSPFPKHTWRPVEGIEEQEEYFQENFYHLLDPQQTPKNSVNELSPPSREGSSPSLYIEKTDHDGSNNERAPLRSASVADSIYGNIRIFAPASKKPQSQLVKKSSEDVAGAGAEVDHQTINGTKP